MTRNPSEYKCEMCNKYYSTKFNLQKHVKICKIKIENEKQTTCIGCEKTFNSIFTLNTHYKKCVYKKLIDLELENNNLKSLCETIKEEKIKLEIELKLRSDLPVGTTITNNYTSNNNSNTSNNHITLRQIVSKLEPICQDEIKSSMSLYTNEYVDDGIKGFARFLCDHSCNNKIITSDNSRHTIAYRTKFDDFIRDPECLNLINNTLKNNSEEIIQRADERRRYYTNHEEYNTFSKRIGRIIELRKLTEAAVKEKPDDNIKAISNLLCEHGLKTFHNNKSLT
jgi:hypothetical protein